LAAASISQDFRAASLKNALDDAMPPSSTSQRPSWLRATRVQKYRGN
jgi:hypothetical protein